MIKCIFAPNYHFFFIQGWVRHGITLSDSIPYDQIRNYSLILQQPHLRKKHVYMTYSKSVFNG